MDCTNFVGQKGFIMSSLRVEPLVDVRSVVGEGPLWEDSEQTLLFVDIIGKKIHRWNSATNQIATLQTDDHVGFAVAARGGGYVAGIGRSFSSVDWSTGAVTSLVSVEDDKHENRINDGKVDPNGRLFAGTMGTEESPGVYQTNRGSLYSLNQDLKVQQHLDQVSISNGLGWSSDGRLMFYIDSLRKTVDVFDYDATSGHMEKRRPLYQLQPEEGLPDGLTVDSDDRLWVACFSGGRVLHIDTTTGALLRTVSFPVTQTTSCCFGGRDYGELFVTSGSYLSQSELSAQPLAGATFRVTGLGVKGRPSVEFSGRVLK